MSDPAASVPTDPSSSASESADFGVAGTIGPFQYGILISWALLGMLVHQVYIYNSRYAKMDARFFRILVHGVLIIEFVLVAIMTHLVHALVIAGWGNPTVLAVLPWSAVMLGLSTSITAVIVQLFFVWRLWQLNSQSTILRILIVFVGAVAFVHFGCSLALTNPAYYGESGVEPENNTAGLHIVTVLIETACVSSFTCDILITSLMLFSLYRLRQKSKAIRSTSMTINALMIRAVETGTVTTLAALIELILYAHPTLQQSAYYVTPHIALGRLYSTMLLANLNGRGHFSGASDATSVRSVQLDTRFDVELSNRTIEASRRPTTDIHVSTLVEKDAGSTLVGSTLIGSKKA